MGKAWRERMDAARAFLETAQPTTGRAVGYHLVSVGLLDSTALIPRIYTRLVTERQEGRIPWDWLVDEASGLEQVATWTGLDELFTHYARHYHRDPWQTQPRRVEVWSEKGTVRGVLRPMLDRYAVGFRSAGGWASWPVVHEAATSLGSQPLHIIYVGDWDPSGLRMSEEDLRARFAWFAEHGYGGPDVTIQRVALTQKDIQDPALPKALEPKKLDPNRAWFIDYTSSSKCWELDALDPNVLRARVEAAIQKLIDWPAWKKSERKERRERRQLGTLTQ